MNKKIFLHFSAFAFVSILLLLVIYVFRIAFFLPSLPEGWVHPLHFDGSNAHKEKVLNFIRLNIEKTHCTTNTQCDDNYLVVFAKKEIVSFYELTVTEEKEVLNTIIKKYCSALPCNYSLIHMIYRNCRS